MIYICDHESEIFTTIEGRAKARLVNTKTYPKTYQTSTTVLPLFCTWQINSYCADRGASSHDPQVHTACERRQLGSEQARHLLPL